MCVRENTARAASVEFVRLRRTNYARSRPQAFCRKNPEGFSTVSDRPRGRSLFAGIPAPASCKRTPHTLQVSLHQPSADPLPFRQGRLWGREMRIATASVRTDLAMTEFPWSVVHGRRATARVAPTEGYKECGRRADVGIGPVAPVFKSCVGRRALTPPRWRSGYRTAGWGQPALQCLAPLPKGGLGGRIATASVRTGFAMTGVFSWGAVDARAGGEIGEAPPVADEARRFRGSAPIGGHNSGRESAGTTVGRLSRQRRD